MVGLDEGHEIVRGGTAVHHVLDRDGQRRVLAGMGIHLAPGPARATAGQDRLRAGDAFEAIAATLGEPFGDEVRGEPERDARATGQERRVRARAADPDEILVRHRVDDRQRLAAVRARAQRRVDRLGAFGHDGSRDVADLGTRLQAQPAADVGVGHRRQRMVLHPRLAEQHVSDEQMPLVDGASHRREGGASDDALDAERVRQGLRDRSDVALGRRIEGRAVLEHELPASLRLQPVQRLERRSDRIREPGPTAISATRPRPRPPG